MTRIAHEFLLPAAFSTAMLTCISLNAAQMASQPWVTNRISAAISDLSKNGNVKSADSAKNAQHADNSDKLGGSTLAQVMDQAEGYAAEAAASKQDRLPYQTNAIPYSAISGAPDMSAKQDMLPYPTNAIPYAAITNTPDMSGYAKKSDLEKKQDCLPYLTNAIPYSAISDVPDLSIFAKNEDLGAKQDLLPYPTNAIPYTAISGKPDMSEKQDRLPYETNAIPYSAVSGTPDLSEYATKAEVSDKQDRLPYETNQIPYSAISGAPDMSAKQDKLPYQTNAIPYSVLEGAPDLSGFASKEDLNSKQDTLPYRTNAIPYAAISDAPDMSLKQDKLPYGTNAIPYSAISGAPEIDLSQSTNYTDYAIVRLAETNDVLKSGPYLTEHQSLQPATNFTTFALEKFAETGTVANAVESDTSSKTRAILDNENEPRNWTYMADIWFHIADDSTNYVNVVASEFEDGTRQVGQANFASEATSASVAFSLSEGDIGYTAEQLIQESTNAADYAVLEFARTNAVLNGGPYLTEHQSLQPATNYADYAVIEMARTNSVLSSGPYVQSATVTNTVRDIVTNTVTIGYTDWTYIGNVTAGTTYTINVTESGANYVFTLYNPSDLGSVTTNILHPTRLDFTGAGIVAECSPIIRNVNGLAMYSDVEALETKIDTMDTSYYRVVGITNKNQSVQFVETDANTTSLQILIPESGMTKDWLVYVKALTNLTLVLPPADYWVVNESVTNEIPPLVPTALYFSQISDNTYSIGRQELIPITVLSQREIENQLIRAKMRKARRLSK